MDKIHFTYAFDSLCGWCYGFGPAIRQFASDNAERVEITVRSGGLFTGDRVMPVSEFPYVKGANAKITELTGVPFGENYNAMLDEGTTIMDSTLAAKGVIALRRQAPDRELEIAGAVQRAWYIDGKDLTDDATYREIAAEMGIDHDAVAKAFDSAETTQEAQREFMELAQMGVDRFPTLIIHTDQGPRVFGTPTTSGADLTRILDAFLAGDIE